jgi:hypothetical protein
VVASCSFFFTQKSKKRARPRMGGRASLSVPSTDALSAGVATQAQFSGSTFTRAARWLLPVHTVTGFVESSTQMLRMLVSAGN